VADKKQLLDLANRVQSKIASDSAVVLGGADGGKVGLVVLLSDSVVARGLSAADIVREAAPIVDGGGGGRDNMAQAGGKDASKLDDALLAARAVIEREVGQ
jgi:alanyl-tRNA synthetase